LEEREGLMSQVKAIPEGYHSVTPYLILGKAAAAIEFYKKAFGAKELYRLSGPEGKVGHAEIQIGNSRIMLADEFPEMDTRGPKSMGGSPISLMIYLENVDQAFAQALKAGAKEVRPLENQFYGDRSGTVLDPFGYKWTLATHVEDLSMEEMRKRSDAFLAASVVD